MKEPFSSRLNGSEGMKDVRTLTTIHVRVQSTKVVITLVRGDETVVVEIPI
jgi:hypothetical protein